MTKSEDIVNLFQQFGGQVDDYQELSRQQSAAQAKKRWPLLSALEVGQTTAIAAPGVVEAEAPVTSGPIEFRPAPVAPPVPVLTPSGQHLCAAELALSTSAPAPAFTPAPAAPPVAAPAPAPVQAAFEPAPAVAAVTAMPKPTPAAPVPTQATVPTASPTLAAAWALPAVATPAHAAESSPPAVPAPVAPVASPPPAPVAAQAPRPAPQALSSASPLASLAQVAPAPAPAPTAPTTELQGIFNRLAGRTDPAPPPPAPSGLAALWQNLRGDA